MSDKPRVWHREVLPEGWARAAGELAGRSMLDGFYLAGGTGLALHFGHRRSVDLDLFGERDFDPVDLQHRLRGLEDLRIQQAAPGTLHIELHRILVSFLHFGYPLLHPLARFESLDVADPRDIACMKLNALAGRGSRRDFVDLYFAAKRYDLEDILGWFETKLASTPYNRVHLFKALTYFKDAEAEPMPNMLIPVTWAEVTDFFVSEVPRLSGLR